MSDDTGSLLGTMRQPQPDTDPDSVESLRDWQSRSVAGQQQDSPINQLVKSGATLSIGPNGISAKGLDQRYVESLFQKSAKLDEIMGSFHQEAERLKGQEARLATPGGAIGNAFSVLAGNLASQHDMPGWVRGLGQTAKDLNPTRDELVNRRLAVESKEAGIVEKQMQLGEAGLRAQDASRYKEEQAASKKQEIVNKAINAVSRLAPLKTGQPLSREGVYSYLKAQNINDPDVLKAAYDAHVEMARTAQEGRADTQSDKAALLKLKNEGARSLEDKRHGYRQAEIEQRFQNSMTKLGASEEFQRSMKDYSDNLANDKQFSRVPTKEMSRLVEIRGLHKYTDEVRQIMNSPEMEGYTGPLQAERILPRFAQSPMRAKVEEFFAQEIGRINNNVLKGGVRMVSSPQGRAFIQDNLGFKTNLPRESILAILDNVDTITDNEVQSIVEGTPNAPWRKVPALLGNTYDYAVSLGEGQTPIAPAGLTGASAPGPSAPRKAPPSPPKDPKFKTAAEDAAKRGKGIEDASGNLWTIKGGVLTFVPKPVK